MKRDIRDVLNEMGVYIKEQKRPEFSEEWITTPNDCADAMAYWAKTFHDSICNNIAETIELVKQERLNRKWQRIFIALIIANIIIWSQII